MLNAAAELVTAPLWFMLLVCHMYCVISHYDLCEVFISVCIITGLLQTTTFVRAFYLSGECRLLPDALIGGGYTCRHSEVKDPLCVFFL